MMSESFTTPEINITVMADNHRIANHGIIRFSKIDPKDPPSHFKQIKCKDGKYSQLS